MPFTLEVMEFRDDAMPLLEMTEVVATTPLTVEVSVFPATL